MAQVYYTLRNNGGDTYQMPMVGFGTYLDVGYESISNAIAVGYRHIDTAEYYRNEEYVGEAIRASGIPRSEFFITTKLAPGGFDSPFKTYSETIESFERSLKSLDCEYIDLYLIHHAFAKNERIDQWRALVDLRRQGKVRLIGVSNWNIKHIEEIKAAGLELPAVNQIEIHPLCTQSELVAYLRAHNIHITAYSSLAPLSTWRAENPGKSSKLENDSELEAVLSRLSLKYGVSEARILLRWGIEQQYSVLPKSAKLARIRDNFDVCSFSLSVEDVAELSQFDKNMPYAWPSGNPLLCD